MVPQDNSKNKPQNSSPHPGNSPRHRGVPSANVTDLQRAAYNEARRWACRPCNWAASAHPESVAAYLMRVLGGGGLEAGTLRRIARRVSERCAAELDSGARRASFAKLQGGRGIASGEARRGRSVERDAEIVRRVAGGESQAGVARALGLSRCAVQNVLKRPRGGGAYEPKTGVFRDRRIGKNQKTPVHRQAGKPAWHNIRTADLRDPHRLTELHGAAVLAGAPLSATAADRLTFFALAARARRVSTENACGLFRRLVETPAYRQFPSAGDEDAARAWLRELEPPAAPEVVALVAPPPDPAGPDEPDDARVFGILGLPLVKAGLDVRAAFEFAMADRRVRARLAGWTPERWESAARQYFGGKNRHE